jgi:hypothetical protein
MSDVVVRIALFGWPLVVLALFRWLPRHRAVIAGVVAGTLFLPEVQSPPCNSQAPDPTSFVFLVLKFTKPNTIAFSALLGAVLFDSRRVFAFRPRWFDLPMLVWCVCPFPADLAIGVGTYDSFAAMRDQTLVWGVPYFLGRVYAADLAGFRDLALGVLLGGVVYAPICIYESFLYPRFHRNLYGFFPGDETEVFRWGGYRPVAFMTHGLMTALWVVAVAVVATWLWWTGAATRLHWRKGLPPLPLRWLIPVLLFAAVAMRSAGAIALGAAGLAALFQLRWLKLPVLMLVLLALSPLYMAGRISGALTAKTVTGGLFGDAAQGKDAQEDVKDREASLQFRLSNEDRLIPYSLQRPALGWGDTGLSRKVPKLKKDEGDIVTDGFWIITLSCYGLIGLTAIWSAMLLPAVRFLWTYPARQWSHPALAPVTAGVVVVILYMIDNLSNALHNPIYLMMAGGVSGLVGSRLPQPAIMR